MIRIMQHCFGKDNSGGPVNAFNRLLKYSKYDYMVIRQLEGAGGINKQLINQFVSEIKKQKPQLIHIRGLGNEGFHAALAARLAGVPNILVSIHGTHRDLNYSSNFLKKWFIVNVLERLTLIIATDIVTVCDFAKNRKFLVPFSDKIKAVIPNGAIIPEILSETEKKLIKKKFNIPEDSVVGLCVSRITVEKGYLVLAAALKKIDIPENKFILFVVGGGDEYGYVQALFAGLNFIKVNFVGHIKDVKNYYALSDFFIFPSLHENLSNALIEAMSHQLPAIATRVGGNTEVIYKGGGTLISVDSSIELAEAIINYVQHPDLRRTLGIAARENIIKNYSIAQMVESWENLYLDIARRKNEQT